MNTFKLLPLLMAFIVFVLSVYIRFTSDSLVENLKQEFSRKYNKPENSIILQVEVRTDLFAKGSVRFSEENPGAIWFGAKIEDKWKLVADGQGPMNCEIANSYKMPESMVPQCLTQEGDLIPR